MLQSARVWIDNLSGSTSSSSSSSISSTVDSLDIKTQAPTDISNLGSVDSVSGLGSHDGLLENVPLNSSSSSHQPEPLAGGLPHAGSSNAQQNGYSSSSSKSSSNESSSESSQHHSPVPSPQSLHPPHIAKDQEQELVSSSIVKTHSGWRESLGG